MLISFDPDRTKVVVTQSTCFHHQKYPNDISWPGCSCSASYRNIEVTPEEYAERRKRRLTEELKGLEARVRAIRREIGHQSGG